MYVVGALKYSVKSAAVGAGESRRKLYGLGRQDDAGLTDDSGVPSSG